MSSSSFGSNIPAPDAVRVVVSALADESPIVRQASMASLKDIAKINPLLVLDCCSSVSRGGRRRFGNMSGVFQVMAFAVSAMDDEDVDPGYMLKLAKIATTEMISSKEFDVEWQRAACSLLVSIGMHLPDLMMEEIFQHLSGTSSSSPSIIQVLADFASSDALQFTPRLKVVLSKVLPILGNVKDAHRPTFANAFKCWCQAICQYTTEYASEFLLDGDIMSYFHSAFELLLRVWASSRELKVRLASVEALGQMVGLVSRTQLKTAVPRLVPTILELLKKDQDIALVATCSLHNLLNASLLSDTGPPLLEFDDLTVIVSTLLPVVCFNSESNERSGFSAGLKIYNEVQHCFLSVGLVYPEELFMFLLNKCRLKEESLMYGSLCVLKHLLPRLTEAWHSKRPQLVEIVESLLDEQSLSICKALSELIVVMASHCYLIGHSGEMLVEFLVRHCGLSDQEMVESKSSNAHYSFLPKKSEVKIGFIQPTELRAICEKSLLLLAITIPEMEFILWPFLLKMIIPRLYTGAVATVCRCISELCRLRSSHNRSLIDECRSRSDIPKPEELFARLIVLLHDPLAREQIAFQILTVLCHLAPLFPKNLNLFWQDEIPKMKAYIGDTEDLKQDSSYQETWDSMIVNFLAESVDVIQDADWLMSLGNAFAEQYELYSTDDEHSALLHRCLGVLLQRVGDRYYIMSKIDWMYEHANISIPSNRLGLAKAMGLVAASHLDTVLGKLKNILDNMGQSIIRRFLSLFSDTTATEESDDIHAALALMYGYAARYAPSNVIEARIDALVTPLDQYGKLKRVGRLGCIADYLLYEVSGTNMLSRLLHVHNPTAKQAVITAIDLLGRAVINAAEGGAAFPLKNRDQLLDYVLTLMGLDDSEGYADPDAEFLRTLAIALSSCTTLVSVEPKLTVETRNYIMKATLGFFTLPSEPVDVIDPVIQNLTTLLCAILLTSGEDGRSRAELLLFILRQIDQYVSSPVECQRRRGCLAALELLLKFQTLCATGHCSLGCLGSCSHRKHNARLVPGNMSNLLSTFVLPSRDSLCIGERVIMYLPRCADTNSEVRKHSAQVIDKFFSIALTLPRPVVTSFDPAIELSYGALSSLEDIIAILRSDASIDPSEVFNRVVSSVGVLLTKDELVATLHGCSTAISDKVKHSAEGAIIAIIEFVTKRGNELSESDIMRTAQSLLSAMDSVSEKNLRREILGAISCLAEITSPKAVFSEVLIAAEKDITRKDITRLRGGWPKQEVFHAFSQHTVLSSLFLEHAIFILNYQSNVGSTAEVERGDCVAASVDAHPEDNLLRAVVIALTAFFRGGGKVGRKAVEQSYAVVLAALTVHLGSCYSKASSGQSEPLRDLLAAFQAFCECVGDLEMGKILAREGVQKENEKWIVLIGDLAGCISIKRPKEVSTISVILSTSLDRPVKSEREAAAAALSEFVRYSERFDSLLEQMVEALCRHISDESAAVRRLCLRGLVQIPRVQMVRYAPQVLGVIVALLGDLDESVQLTAVSCLLMVLESSDKEAVEPTLPNLYIHVRNLQVSLNSKMRAYAFAAFGALSDFGVLANLEAFIEQVHNAFPRLILHLHDDDFTVRTACRSTIRKIYPLLELDGISVLLNMHCFNSDHRSDYEDFVHDLTGQLCQNLQSKVDSYMASIVQAFDSPSPTIQANAIYCSSSVLCLSEDQRISSLYYSQVFSVLMSKMSKSPDATVRATCSSALGLLLKSANLQLWTDSRLDHGGSSRWSQDSDSVRR